jgi:CCR4-NOT transcriptional regulation complex NOT5 subunit
MERNKMSTRELKRKDPVKYAAGAIEELTRQLATATTDARKAKLLGRIEHWKKIAGEK